MAELGKGLNTVGPIRMIKSDGSTVEVVDEGGDSVAPVDTTNVTASGLITASASGIATSVSNAIVPVMFTAATEVIAAGNPGAISVACYATHASVDVGGDAFTLASGSVVGQLKRIYLLKTDGGTGVVSGVFRGTNNRLTFTNAGEYAELIWDGSRWLDVALGSTSDTNIDVPPVLSQGT